MLFQLEKQGRYDEALFEIGDLWLNKDILPNTDELAPHLAAEFILRCGSIYGFLGHTKQIPNSQERSRSLLSYARSLFIEHYNTEKVAECENYLALTYWRTGEVNEALVWLEESFSHKLANSNDTRLYTFIIKSLVLVSQHKPLEILETLSGIENYISGSEDNSLKGAYYNQIGIAWDITGHIPNALSNLEISKYFYALADHKIYLGVVCNDLSLLYKTARNFEKAHQFIDTATETFRNIKDRSREGYSLDTKACIYLAEGKNKEALETIETAISILAGGENFTYRVETLSTKIKILISMNEISPATFCLIEAVEIARTKISEAAAENLVKDYENCLRERLSSSSKTNPESLENIIEDETTDDFSTDNIELVLPSPLSNFEDIQGIWINNSHLEEIGILKNSLAVIVPTGDVSRGDLIAVEEIENKSVSCGFYDNEFGIVCLEGYDGEPLLFDEEKIRIIGKIVGVANAKTDDGKLIVEPI